MHSHELMTELPYGLPGTIFRSPLPFSPLFDPQGILLDAFLATGVEDVVMLTSIDEVEGLTGLNLRACYEALDFNVIYAPVVDFSVPEVGAFQAPIEEILQAANAGETIVIHCHAGLGRTGMFAACLAKVVFDMEGEQASNWVRKYIPRAIETLEQRAFVDEFKFAID